MVEFLETNPVLHMMMIESVRRGNADILADRPDGVMLLDRPSRTHMLAAANPDAAREMLDRVESFAMLTMHDEHTLGEARRRYQSKHFLDLVQAVYPKKAIDRIPGDIRRLDMSYFDFMRAHYDNIDDDGYIAERLSGGEVYGIFVDGALAGFMGTHQEGSLGMLEILPAYRRRGLAEALERHVIDIHLSRGWMPFSQIKPDNPASLSLHEKLGFEISTEHMYWLY